MYIKRELYTYSASEQLPQLLQAVMCGELIAPSRQLWLFSPWISNIPILNNVGNSFRHIEPQWPRGRIYLYTVLEKLLEKGTSIYLVTNISKHNDDIFLWLDRMKAMGYTHLNGFKKSELHQKGLLGDTFYIKGSMNFTFNGLSILDERIEFVNDPAEVAKAKIEFDLYWRDNVGKYS